MTDLEGRIRACENCEQTDACNRTLAKGSKDSPSDLSFCPNDASLSEYKAKVERIAVSAATACRPNRPSINPSPSQKNNPALASRPSTFAVSQGCTKGYWPSSQQSQSALASSRIPLTPRMTSSSP